MSKNQGGEKENWAAAMIPARKPAENQSSTNFGIATRRIPSSGGDFYKNPDIFLVTAPQCDT